MDAGECLEMSKMGVLLTALLLGGAFGAQAAVFKCIDPSGKAVYQGMPCADDQTEQKVAETETSAGQARWSELRQGVLVDATTQMRWTQRDNGADIDWAGADDYCRHLGLAGGGWSLPTTKELTHVLDCQQRRCRLPGLFTLSLAGPMLWSRTKVASNRAEFADLGVAALGHAAMHAAGSKRALCVRMP